MSAAQQCSAPINEDLYARDVFRQRNIRLPWDLSPYARHEIAQDPELMTVDRPTILDRVPIANPRLV